ncbi:MAG: DUF423 domain-containing protein [Gemmatimonadota bacterium]|jgi:uncharacterized membrane protein YgdD (TMEM256/DUF423 family)|nr:MAG: DUF423 domain-containing protein [Gemmatimonadota bacterium]
MSRTFFILGTALAFVCVAAGALGAHVLQDRLSAELLSAWETGARYGIVHALALLITSTAMARWPGSLWTAAGWLFAGGALVFSGSLFGLALSGARGLGAVTPIGGLAMLLGWVVSSAAAWKNMRGRPRDGAA